VEDISADMAGSNPVGAIYHIPSGFYDDKVIT